MKVSYIGNFSVSFSTETHIAKAWENIGVEVNRIPEQRLHWPDLPELTEGSDLVLWTRTAGFDPPDLTAQAEAVEAVSVPVVGYHLDRWWGLDRQADVDRSPWFTSTDFLCTADGGHQAEWKAKGIVHHWFPPAILGDECELGTQLPQYRFDVGFVGNLVGYGHKEWGPYRLELYNFLTRKYGRGFKLFPGKGRPQIRGRQLASVYASVKVLVGDSCLAGDATRYWSDRVPETMGRGGYLIHPWVEGIDEHYPDLTTYRLGDFDGLGKAIDAALNQVDLRKQLAKENRSQVLAFDTYETRMRQLLAIL